MSALLFVYLSIILPIRLPVYFFLPISCLHDYLLIAVASCLPLIYSSTCLLICLSTCLFSEPPDGNLPTYHSSCLLVHLFDWLVFCLFISVDHVSACPSVCLFGCLSSYLCTYQHNCLNAWFFTYLSIFYQPIVCIPFCLLLVY